MSTSTTGQEQRRIPLSRERVLEAALRLADQGGLGSLSMRKLGQAVGVEAMALYYHFANKERVLDGIVDLVFGEIELPQIGADWKSAMRRRAISVRDALLRHRWAIGLMESRTNPGPANLRHHDAVIGCLRAAGFDRHSSWERSRSRWCWSSAPVFSYEASCASFTWIRGLPPRTSSPWASIFPLLVIPRGSRSGPDGTRCARFRPSS